MTLIEPADAAQELLRRRRARRSLRHWALAKGYKPAKHHLVIIDNVEAFLKSPDEEILLIAAPPGSAKSTYISVLTPSWYLANHPENSILAATHSGEFAERWGRRIRGDLMEHNMTLGITLRDDVKAACRWALKSGGEYYGVGVGVGISGFRADLGIGDDLFGNREDAWSETIREKRWEWFRDDFSARLKPKAKRILISTRWHEEDVFGRLLHMIESGIIKGRVVIIAAEAEAGDILGREPGELLWGDQADYDYADFLRSRKRETSPMMWSALYQQRPSPETGDYFKAEWLKPYEHAPDPKTLRTYGGSDYAVTADGGDYTVHLCLGLDPEGRMYLLDVWRKQTSSEQWIEAFCDIAAKWQPFNWAEETGQIKAGVGPFLDRRMRERQVYCPRQPFPTRGDKAVRAQSIRGRMALNGLYVPVNAPWYAAFRSELMSFPAGTHDDQVDALGLVGQLLDSMLHGTSSSLPIDKRKRDAYDDEEDFGETVPWQLV